MTGNEIVEITIPYPKFGFRAFMLIFSTMLRMGVYTPKAREYFCRTIKKSYETSVSINHTQEYDCSEFHTP